MADFFALLYEMFGISPNFANELYNQSIYTPLGLSMMIISLIICAGFYYVLNHPGYNRWIHWLGFGILNALIHFLIGSFYPTSVMPPETAYIYISESYMLGMINSVLSLLTFTIISFIIRWGSANCKSTPYPQ